MTRDETETQPIFLIGFMGSGKSTVGRELARRLARVFVDLDEEIVRTARKSVTDIIRERGEPEFRAVESECLRVASSGHGTVVATGGGVVLKAENRDAMRSSGTTVWLDVPFELCWAHLELDRTERPLAPDRQTALKRYNERLEFYQSAEIQVHIDDSMSVETIVEAIIGRLRKV